MEINGMDEKILFKRANGSVSINDENDRGVLVVDPNRVVNEYGEIKDRYVKQEDLLIYASLKVYKRDDYSVTYDSNRQTYYTEINQAPIHINFLNPLSNRQRDNGTYEFKNKFTSDWVDFFTDDSKNNENNIDYILDPEIFGITNISIKINASYVPIITIEFTDIQGRTLFERGNDENNPYNIFFTYPYPKFLLTYKGYYGRAVETNLVLLKSNTKYDPSTGNYNITAEFQSDVFAFLSTFLIVYGYVAPYMFKTNDGQYLGGKILSSLYERQNKAIKELVGEVDFPKYEITGSPTLYDLGNALKDINYNNTVQISNDSSNNIDIINENKLIIESYSKSLIDYISNNPSEYIKLTSNTNNSIFYNPISDNNKISDRNQSPLKLFDYIRQINNSISTLSNINLSNNSINTFYSDIINEIQKNENLKQYSSNNNLSKERLILGGLFLLNDINNPDAISLNKFDLLIGIVKKYLSKLKSTIEENYITEEITELKNFLRYEPNLDNINRIIANNMQVFLILLDLIGRSAVKQIKEDASRSNTHLQKTGYKIEFNKSIFSAFPEYYRILDEFVEGNQIERKYQGYPGEDASNKNWFEVLFVEEIYSAMNRLKEESGLPEVIKHEQINTGLLSIFQLGENDLSTYNSQDFSKVIGELLQKFGLYFSYSGIWNRNLKDINKDIIPKIAEFEFELIKSNVIQKMTSSENKFVFVNELKNYTKSFTENGIDYTNLGNLALRKIFFGDGTSVNSLLVIRDFIQKSANLFSTSYSEDHFKKSMREYGQVFKGKNRKTSASNSEGIRDNNLYENISFKKLNKDINLTSFNSFSKTKKIKHLVDLSSNFNYFCDGYNKLSSISSNFSSIDNITTNNFFQGYYENLNFYLSTQPHVVDFSRGLPYGLSQNTPPLTFNSKISDYSEDINRSIFSAVSYSGTINYSVIFNKL